MLLVGLLLAGVIALLFMRKRTAVVDEPDTRRAKVDDIDTVAAWPPDVTRLLTGGERSAHEVLQKALPECMLFAQVPLARFIKVPRRHSYAEWLTRVGHLCADLVICDRSTLVIGVVLLTSIRSSDRADRRRQRMTRVLKAAGVKVFVWREEALPSPDFARDQITQRLGDLDEERDKPEDDHKPHLRPVPGSIPVPEVLNVPFEDEPRQDPPPSTWFDDLDGGKARATADDPRARAGAPAPRGNGPDPWSGSGRR